MRALLDELSAMTPLNAVQGSNELHNFLGARVLEHTTSTGRVLAIKANTGVTRSEADMMHYAATHGVLAPRVHAVYDIIVVASSKRTPLMLAMVSERVPGVPLVDVWQGMSVADQAAVKEQLRVQLGSMRACTQPFIGRVGGRETRNCYDGMRDLYCGPFGSEDEFDRWCSRRVCGGPLVRFKWWRWLQGERKKRGMAGKEERFVLTHGDLTPRNIMVQGNRVTGIIDWERSGFWPEWAEYAFNMVLCQGHEEWWVPVLAELLTPCSQERLDFTALVEEWVVNCDETGTTNL